MKIKIGVMGSAGGKIAEEISKKVYELGRQIAKRDCVIVTGGCPGLPFEATTNLVASPWLVFFVQPVVPVA